MFRLLGALVLALGVAMPACAVVTYDFSTDEPFAGGRLSFSYAAPDFVTSTSFVDASALTSATPSITRIQFDPSCSFGGGNCAQLSVFANTSFGTTQAIRYFTRDAFSTPGTYAARSGTAATLQVTAEATNVPEPATWALFIVGFAAVGVGLRRQNRELLPATGL